MVLKKLIAEFPDKLWTLKTNYCRKLTTDGTIERQHGSGWKWRVSKNKEFIDEAVKQWRPRL